MIRHHQNSQAAEADEYTDCTSAEVKPTPNECPGYDTKQSNCEVPLMLEFWRMQCTSSLQSLLGLLLLGEVAPDNVLSMGQTELNCLLRQDFFAFKLCILAKVNCLKYNC